MPCWDCVIGERLIENTTIGDQLIENSTTGDQLIGSGNRMVGERLSGNTMVGERLPPYGPLSIISQNASVLDEAGESVERLWLFFTFLPMASIICCQVT